jgi:glucan 1,3-beta-glucosidase
MSARVIAALLGTILAGCAAQRLQPTPAPVSFLRTDGLHIVNERGDRVALRGYNLGSWLLLEPWMVKLDSQEGVKAEKDVWDQIARRFGEEKMRAAVAAHRASFITESDIERLHQLHINFVRVPIWWRVLGDTMYDADGWRYVDQLLDWCERRGMYVLLDLHGAPGGQNTGANILGEAPTGNYWLSDRTATLDWWRKVARR